MKYTLITHKYRINKLSYNGNKPFSFNTLNLKARLVWTPPFLPSVYSVLHL